VSPRASTRSLNLTAQALSLVLAVVLIHSVWRNTGSRLAIIAEVALVVALLANLAWSASVTGRVSVSVLELPADATAGDEVGCTINVQGSSTPVAVRMISSPRARWFRVVPRLASGERRVRGAGTPGKWVEQGVLGAVAGSRGVATAAVFEVSSTAPLGLVGLNRRLVVDLPHPLHVGPKPVPVTDARLPERRIRSSAEEDVRGTRAWTQGDPLRRVHWPTVARTGELAVREYEPPATATILLVLDLGDGGLAGEAAAGRAAWVADEALRRGHRVILSCVEPGGPVVGLVRSRLEVSRRLAAAVRGEPVSPSTGRDGELVVWISDSGDRWPT
jgi:uncharacterized protein (DUF58 family)